MEVPDYKSGVESGVYLCRPGPRPESPKWTGPNPWVATAVVTAVIFIVMRLL